MLKFLRLFADNLRCASFREASAPVNFCSYDQNLTRVI